MIVLSSTGTDLCRFLLRWTLCHTLQPIVRKVSPVSHFFHNLIFTRWPDAAEQQGSWKVDETFQSAK